MQKREFKAKAKDASFQKPEQDRAGSGNPAKAAFGDAHLSDDEAVAKMGHPALVAMVFGVAQGVPFQGKSESHFNAKGG